MSRVKGQWAICIHTRLATSPLRSGFDCESLIKHARNAWVPLCSSYFDPPFLSAFFVLSAMMRLICTVASAAWLKLLCRSSGQHFHSIFQGCLKWGMPWNRRSIDIFILLLWDMMKPGIWGVHNFRDNTQLQPFCSALLVILVYDDSVDDVGLCRIPMLGYNFKKQIEAVEEGKQKYVCWYTPSLLLQLAHTFFSGWFSLVGFRLDVSIYIMIIMVITCHCLGEGRVQHVFLFLGKTWLQVLY